MHLDAEYREIKLCYEVLSDVTNMIMIPVDDDGDTMMMIMAMIMKCYKY